MQADDDFQRELRNALRGEAKPRASQTNTVSGNTGIAVSGSGNTIFIAAAPPARTRRRWTTAWIAAFLTLFVGHVLATLNWAARVPGDAPARQLLQLLSGGGPGDLLASGAFAAAGSTLVVLAAWAVRWFVRRFEDV